MPFYRRRWDETRGDSHDDWGPATYYVWVHEGRVEQQVEIYDAGVMLAYDHSHVEDEFGFMMSDFDRGEWAPFEVVIDTYQREVDGQAFNRR